MPPVLAAGLVFGASAAVLVLEILAARLLAPFVGVTLETYTGIIGVVLAGISLGTWLGGRAADRFEPRRLVGPLLVSGGLLALLIVPLITFVAALSPGSGPIAIVLFTSVTFFAPAAVLSTITPVVIKLQLRDLGQTGQIVGRLSAIGTAGAIVGTFVTGFVLVAAVPTRATVLLVGGALVGAGILLWWWLDRRMDRGLLAAMAALTTLGAAGSVVAPQPCEHQSPYFCIRVEADPDRESGRILFLDTLRHSAVDLSDPLHLEFRYTQLIRDVIDATIPAETPLRALHIGGGGFTLPRYLEAARPTSLHRVLELDPAVLAVARSELGLALTPRIEVELGDARLSVAHEPAQTYHVVVGDAFGGLAVPWHLTTVEMVQLIRRTMQPDGLYVLNVIDQPPLAFARAELATLRSVFRDVALFVPPAFLGQEAGGNLILIASDAPIPAVAVERARQAAGGDERIARGAALDAFIGDAPVLTDDHAPVDQLLTTGL